MLRISTVENIIQEVSGYLSRQGSSPHAKSVVPAGITFISVPSQTGISLNYLLGTATFSLDNLTTSEVKENSIQHLIQLISACHDPSCKHIISKISNTHIFLPIFIVKLQLETTYRTFGKLLGTLRISKTTSPETSLFIKK
ncbi:hypothetical protein CEXT_210881 [Caerostris extrusa]|uniref:LAGLIDADG homing endonuclease n=1 Tax=Caerostris extrusa TaxID=172846 RepID=A0AAV4NTB3_CAEEX|nr:hypothetical protein CEXT_210881 [Caerostris extrusa]